MLLVLCYNYLCTSGDLCLPIAALVIIKWLDEICFLAIFIVDVDRVDLVGACRFYLRFT